MMSRGVRMLACFLATCLAYWAYSLLAVPWIEPSLATRPADDHRPATAAAPAARQDPLAELFAEGSWELGNPKLLKTDQGMLLFEDYRPIGGNQLELRPCTLVFFVDGKLGEQPAPGTGAGQRRALVLRAPQRAVLEFEGDVDLLKARLGRLRGGRLEGDVLVYTAPDAPDSAQHLRIATRNVQISQQRIWTPHELDFQFGPHHGRGRQLTVQLGSPDRVAAARPSGKSPAAVQWLELSHVEKLSLLLPGDLEPQRPPAASPGNAGAGLGREGAESAAESVIVAESAAESATAAERMPAQDAGPALTPVELTCEGPFRFDFQQQAASFERNVDVIRLRPEGPSDALKCHRLTILFRKAAADGAAAAVPDAAANVAADGKRAGSGLGAMQIDRVVAVGAPVQLNLFSFDSDVRAELLEYRFATRTLHVRDSRGVRLRQQHHHVTAPELEYQLAESAQGLGRLWASGPGQFVSHAAEQGLPPLEASWNGQLRLVPDGQEHVLSLDAGARARLDNLGGFSAQRLYFWLHAVSPTGPAHGPAPPRDTPAGDSSSGGPAIGGPAIGGPVTGGPKAGESRRARIVPSKLLAEGNVAFDSPQLAGGTQRLEAWFHPADPSLAAGPGESGELTGRAATPSPTGIVRPPLAGGKPGAAQLRLRGNLIRLQIVERDRWNVQHASVLGDVQLDQAVERPDQQAPVDQQQPLDQQPLVVRGDALEVDQGVDGRGQLDITGRPATITAQGLTVVGSNVHLRQRDNRLWMDGPGSMTLPLSGLASSTAARPGPAGVFPPGASAGNGSRALAAPPPITITWQGGMRFNGHTALFDRQVETRGQQSATDGTRNELGIQAATLEVELTEMLDFAAPQARDVDVKQLRFAGQGQGVLLTNESRDAAGARQSLDAMQAVQLTLEGTTGKFEAQGPGWVRTTRFGRDGFLDPAGRSSEQTAQSPGSPPAAGFAPQLTPPPPQPARPPQLVYLFVSFEDRIAGNMLQRELHFLKQVEVVYGPVPSWESQLRGMALEQLPPGSVTMNCDTLAVADMGRDGTAQLELLATGNTLVEGMTHQGRFAAQAQRLSYVQAKDLLVMEGDGRRDATWEGQMLGKPGRSRAAARKIMYSRRDGRVEVDSFQYLNLGQ
ncbi:MAG: hypothetical protein J5I93_07100 [Pirellulaceae bacterium]|nr:hypothetical protein [Pirellulaceae bacterium]